MNKQQRENARHYVNWCAMHNTKMYPKTPHGLYKRWVASRLTRRMKRRMEAELSVGNNKRAMMIQCRLKTFPIYLTHKETILLYESRVVLQIY